MTAMKAIAWRLPKMPKIKITKTYEVTKITAILTLVGFIMGLEVPSLATFLTNKTFNEYFKYPTPLQQGLLMGSTPLGGIMGCFIYCIMNDRFSRIYQFQSGIIIWNIVTLLNFCIWDILGLLICRMIKGMILGNFSILVASYANEVIPRGKRGSTMSYIQLCLTIGILVMHYLCIVLSLWDSHFAFRIAWCIGIIPGLLFWMASYALPESYHWLVLHGKMSEAQDIQHNLAKKFNESQPRDSVPEMSKIELAGDFWIGVNDLDFSKKLPRGSFKPLILGMTSQLLVQFSGINIILGYITYICEIVGLEGNVKLFTSSIPYFINMVLSLLPITFIDYTSRKLITLLGGFPISGLLITIGALFVKYGQDTKPIDGNRSLVWSIGENPFVGGWILTLCFLIVGIFAMSLSSIPWVYTNEMLPSRVKVKGFAICITFGWLGNFILTFLCPVMIERLKGTTFIIFGSLTFLISLSVLIWFPETKGMSIEDIDKFFEFESKESTNLHGEKCIKTPDSNSNGGSTRSSQEGQLHKPIKLKSDEEMII
ncbi:AEG_G0017020.mRNA.1.CDS.1 [Saccharomyces cerevisiae]|nr:AEG_G0017020.mRNA.1.CDS.1 [Saccharomyces cerevisiae]CAI4519946.1 BCN_G0018230.mRNA.1.CDS.1 [Saccharomyces cerevisiae]CAI4538047.1 BCE_3a_G0018110.mRNA.1.CDS.1 [Saccharomyces cerevisiae]CAI5256938.1 ALI_HP2_G0012020.mRNA.1.CDS.1 [Saccharomyces cerevisiae]CAI6452615.1 ALI_HP2_G0012020.mRNA.1.CDS.1 [Saccharomyces cerevisiae]